MKCSSCIHYKYPIELAVGLGCKLWTDFKLNIKRLPISTGCPSCGGYQPVTPNEFVSEIKKTGPKKFVVGVVTMGNIDRYGGVIVGPSDKCMFYKAK